MTSVSAGIPRWIRVESSLAILSKSKSTRKPFLKATPDGGGMCSTHSRIVRSAVNKVSAAEGILHVSQCADVFGRVFPQHHEIRFKSGSDSAELMVSSKSLGGRSRQ